MVIKDFLIHLFKHYGWTVTEDTDNYIIFTKEKNQIDFEFYNDGQSIVGIY